MSLRASRGRLSTHNGTLAGIIPGLVDFTAARGVNASGGEFAGDVPSTSHGTPGVDYNYNPTSYLTYLKSRGHRIVRIPFRWQRIQPVLSGPLDPAGIAALRTAVQNAADAGLMVLLDLHNYGRFYQLDGSQVMFFNGITVADYQDIWTRLAHEFAGQPWVAAFGLMNEPHDLPTNPNYFTPSAGGYTFDSSTSSWVVSGGGATLAVGSYPGMTSGGALSVSKVLPASTTNYSAFMRINEPTNQQIQTDSLAADDVIEWTLYVPTSTPGQVRVRTELVNTTFTGVYPDGYTTLTSGYVTKVYQTIPAGMTGLNHRNVVLQAEVQGSDGVTPTVIYIDSVRVGKVSGVKSGWKVFSQAAVDAIRAAGEWRPLFIAGDRFGGAQNWETTNGAPWITDPLANIYYEAHYYCSQQYNGNSFTTYSDGDTFSKGLGFSGLPARVTKELGDFTSWLTKYGVRGFVGEIAIPNDDVTASWNAVLTAMYGVLDAAGVGSTYWTSGASWSPGSRLNAYPGGASAPTPGSPTTVVEAHESITA